MIQKNYLKRKEKFYIADFRKCTSVAVGVKWNDYIDKHNIKIASEDAMKDAISSLSVRPDKVLVDGFSLDIQIENEVS